MNEWMLVVFVLGVIILISWIMLYNERRRNETYIDEIDYLLDENAHLRKGDERRPLV